MTLQTGVGVARGSDGFEAGKEAARAALDRAGGERPDAALVFAAVRYGVEEVRQGVRSVLPDAPLVGCSDAGVIVHAGVKKGVVAVMTLQKPGMTAAAAVVDDLDAERDEPAQRLARSAQAALDPRLRANGVCVTPMTDGAPAKSS